jgi:NAD(P)-dependent dehydrogenase (short-subunit alcohol dehydrogenase family)
MKYYAKKYRNLNVNCIAPGGVVDYDIQDDTFIANYESHGDLLQSNGVNKAVMWLLGDSNVTGQVITIDNGFSI